VRGFDWDSQGNHVAAMTVPGNFKSTVQYDDAGRIASVANAEGHQTSFSYDARNQLIATTSNGIVQSYLYDAMGRQVEIGVGEGKAYNLAIPPQFVYVSQAVALNEYRGHVLPLGRANLFDPHSWGAFPLESIKNDANAPDDPTRVEQGFIGAHADIGGGFKDNQLSKVALAWMIQQAEKAGVKMNDAPATIAANPVLHDKSDAIRFGSPTTGAPLPVDGPWNDAYAFPSPNMQEGTGAEDRTVRYRDGSTTTQRKMAIDGMTNADTDQFITYDPTRSRSDNVTGTVDMKKYLDWLNAYGILNGGQKLNLTVQP